MCTVAFGALAWAGWRGARLALPDCACGLERFVAACTLALVLALSSVAVWAWLTALSATTLLVTLVSAALVLGVWERGRAPACPRSPEAPGVAAWVAIALAASTLLLSAISAYFLPVWQWDSLGYHLPFVYFVLQAGGYAGLPPLVPYLSTYPHGVEHVFLLMRALLPNDDLIDVGQIPLGIVGAAATAGVARRLGAPPFQALVAGACWLALPAVFLQLPSNYVDVGVAAYFLLVAFWVLTPTPAVRPLLLGAVALGLFLGAKPSAPLPVAFLGLVLAARLKTIAGWAHVGLAGGIVLVLGGWSYLDNFLATGNPVWPINVDFGPLHLPGNRVVGKLVAAGAAAPRPQGGLLARLWTSWTTLHGPPAFDMRLGGLGPAFLFFALPGTLVWAWQRARAAGGLLLIVLVLMFAALAHPEPSTARFILAFPALCLACATAAVARARHNVSQGVLVLACVFAGWGLLRALPGLTPGVEPSLWDMARLPPDTRRNAIGPDGSPARWRHLTQGLTSEHVIAFDEALTLPGLLWNEGLTNRVLPLRAELDASQVLALMQAKKVSHLVAGGELAAGQVVREHPHLFEPLFSCGSDPCHVYRVRTWQREHDPGSAPKHD